MTIHLIKAILNLFTLYLPRPQRKVAEPTAAFGPAGSTGEENLSVVVAPITPGFELQSLGSAEQAAARFLSTVISRNSQLETNLIHASSR